MFIELLLSNVSMWVLPGVFIVYLAGLLKSLMLNLKPSYTKNMLGSRRKSFINTLASVSPLRQLYRTIEGCTPTIIGILRRWDP